MRNVAPGLLLFLFVVASSAGMVGAACTGSYYCPGSGYSESVYATVINDCVYNAGTEFCTQITQGRPDEKCGSANSCNITYDINKCVYETETKLNDLTDDPYDYITVRVGCHWESGNPNTHWCCKYDPPDPPPATPSCAVTLPADRTVGAGEETDVTVGSAAVNGAVSSIALSAPGFDPAAPALTPPTTTVTLTAPAAPGAYTLTASGKMSGDTINCTGDTMNVTATQPIVSVTVNAYEALVSHARHRNPNTA